MPIGLHPHDEDIPRFDPWLGVMASSLIPVIVALYVHSRFSVPLIIATVVLFIASLVMLRRQTLRQRRDSDKHSPPHPQSESVHSFNRTPVEIEGAEP